MAAVDELRTRTIINTYDDGRLQTTTEMIRRDSRTQTDMVTVLTRNTIYTKEAVIRNALIELGWTPPVEKED
jgi:hypothetical protein